MKTIQNLRNSLKFKAPLVADALAVIIDGQPYVLKGSEARVLKGERHAYVSAAAFSHIVELLDGDLHPLGDTLAADEIEAELTPQAERPRRSTQSIELPPEVKEQILRSVPDGYRIHMEQDGEIRLVKTRNRGGRSDDDAEFEELD